VFSCSNDLVCSPFFNISLHNNTEKESGFSIKFKTYSFGSGQTIKEIINERSAGWIFQFLTNRKSIVIDFCVGYVCVLSAFGQGLEAIVTFSLNNSYTSYNGYL
jgi:hypothetical protein